MDHFLGWRVNGKEIRAKSRTRKEIKIGDYSLAALN